MAIKVNQAGCRTICFKWQIDPWCYDGFVVVYVNFSYPCVGLGVSVIHGLPESLHAVICISVLILHCSLHSYWIISTTVAKLFRRRGSVTTGDSNNTGQLTKDRPRFYKRSGMMVCPGFILIAMESCCFMWSVTERLVVWFTAAAKRQVVALPGDPSAGSHHSDIAGD